MWKNISKHIVAITPRKCIVTVKDRVNDVHPPLHNHKCHQNSAWHLAHNPEVVAVGRGFIVEKDGYDSIVCHFICLDQWGNWFDPTLGVQIIKDGKFYLLETYTSVEQFNSNNCDKELMDTKRSIYNSLTGWRKFTMWLDKGIHSI